MSLTLLILSLYIWTHIVLTLFIQDSGDLRKDGSRDTLERITKLVNDTLATEESFDGSTLSTDDLLRAIDCGTSEGGPNGRHWVLDPIDGTKG